jgi:hypothetical protein
MINSGVGVLFLAHCKIIHLAPGLEQREGRCS